MCTPIDRVRDYLKNFHLDNRIHETDVSTATVVQAAAAIGVMPAQIAKTLSFNDTEGCILVVAAGDTRIDNKKFKQTFGIKARILSPEDATVYTGFTIGGVCPFIKDRRSDVRVFLDASLKRFDKVYPAAGNAASGVELSCDELYTVSGAQGWIDVCKMPFD